MRACCTLAQPRGPICHTDDQLEETLGGNIDVGSRRRRHRGVALRGEPGRTEGLRILPPPVHVHRRYRMLRRIDGRRPRPRPSRRPEAGDGARRVRPAGVAADNVSSRLRRFLCMARRSTRDPGSRARNGRNVGRHRYVLLVSLISWPNSSLQSPIGRLCSRRGASSRTRRTPVRTPLRYGLADSPPSVPIAVVQERLAFVCDVEFNPGAVDLDADRCDSRVTAPHLERDALGRALEAYHRVPAPDSRDTMAPVHAPRIAAHSAPRAICHGFQCCTPSRAPSAPSWSSRALENKCLQASSAARRHRSVSSAADVGKRLMRPCTHSAHWTRSDAACSRRRSSGTGSMVATAGPSCGSPGAGSCHSRSINAGHLCGRSQHYGDRG